MVLHVGLLHATKQKLSRTSDQYDKDEMLHGGGFNYVPCATVLTNCMTKNTRNYRKWNDHLSLIKVKRYIDTALKKQKSS